MCLYVQKPQIYFTDRKQLLNFMAEMDEKINNLFKELEEIEQTVVSYKGRVTKEQAHM